MFRVLIDFTTELAGFTNQKYIVKLCEPPDTNYD